MIPEFVTKQLHEIATNEEFTDYQFETEKGANHGDNYQSIVMAVKISGTKIQNGVKKHEELHLMCKYPTLNKRRRKIFESDRVFIRELFVYSKMLPHFIQFQREKGLDDSDSFVSFPKVYACKIDDENGIHILIMEDLRAKKYGMWPREKIIPLEHQLFFIRELGKFHAISFAMKDQRPNEFEQYTQFDDIMSDIMSHSSNFIKKSVEKSVNVLKNPVHKKFMSNFQKTYRELMADHKCNEEFCIVGHGDCWINNTMFQYIGNDDQQLKAISFIDWQNARYCPPILDFVYIVFTSTDKEFRRQHHEKMMKTYYSSLSENIRKLGSDPNKLYTYENFQNQLRKSGEYVMLRGLMMVQIKLASAEEVTNIDEYSELIDKGVDVDLINLTDEQSLLEYSRLVNEITTDLFDYGYINLE